MRTPYKRNKLRTALAIMKRLENWPEGWALRLRSKRGTHSLLRFKNGPSVVCRGGTRDWDVLHELFFAGGYAAALRYLKAEQATAGVVLDLGGNIGAFSLLASEHTAPNVVIHAFEPGPENARLFRINTLLNPQFAGRIQLHEEAVGGIDGEALWHFDADNPGASSLYGQGGKSVKVKLASLASVVARFPQPILLVKIDIEGSEYELLEQAPAALWQKIPAIALEVHDDPRGKSNPDAYLQRMRNLGYRVEQEAVISYFLRLESTLAPAAPLD